MCVLVVEDDRALGAFLKNGLQLEGQRVEWVQDGDAALARILEDHPDLVVLDLSLPKRDGMEVLAEMQARHDDAAVLILTGRNDIGARVQCLDMGADDCVLKPFSFFELAARCRALLRRRSQVADSVLRYGDLELNRIEHKVARMGRAIDLTAKEFSLLEYLLLHRGECVSRSQLLADVWQMPTETGTNVVDVYVNYLRRKLEGGPGNETYVSAECGGLIKTERGLGYRLGGLGRKPVARDLGRSSPIAGVACA
jgi:DNA-binding response OmpR family regulator